MKMMSHVMQPVHQPPPAETSSILTEKFPIKLWKLVNDSNIRSINWDDTGNNIIIDSDMFIDDILRCRQHFFQTSNFSSFVRQLNLYGFHKVPCGDKTQKLEPNIHYYANDHFTKAKPDNLVNVCRKANDHNNPNSGRKRGGRRAKQPPVTGDSDEEGDPSYVPSQKIRRSVIQTPRSNQKIRKACKGTAMTPDPADKKASSPPTHHGSTDSTQNDDTLWTIVNSAVGITETPTSPTHILTSRYSANNNNTSLEVIEHEGGNRQSTPSTYTIPPGNYLNPSAHLPPPPYGYWSYPGGYIPNQTHGLPYCQSPYGYYPGYHHGGSQIFVQQQQQPGMTSATEDHNYQQHIVHEHQQPMYCQPSHPVITSPDGKTAVMSPYNPKIEKVYTVDKSKFCPAEGFSVIELRGQVEELLQPTDDITIVIKDDQEAENDETTTTTLL